MFAATTETPIRAEGAKGQAEGVKWRLLSVPQAPRRALVVTCGHAAIFDDIEASPGEQLLLSFGKGLPNISKDGLDVVVLIRDQRSEIPIFRAHVLNDQAWRTEWIHFPRLPFRGSLIIRCGPGPNADPVADWLGLSEIAVGRQKDLRLARARSNKEVRTKNEQAHFSRTYRMPMFTTKAKKNAFGHAIGIIQRRSISHPLDFAARAQRIGEMRQLNVLSICSGAARVEESLFRSLAHRPRLTLLDINEDLLGMAAERLRPYVDLSLICGDANAVELPRRCYDVVVCVAGLHHIVELEHLAGQIAGALTAQGEFWSIGEYVGRNGARLWPESYAVANGIFSSLDSKYRFNNVIGRCDENLSNADCSEASFEGIRAEEVEQVLGEYLVPHQVDRWSTIGWRVIGPAYVDNYDVDEPGDLSLVEQIANRDAELFLSGALPSVAMRGIFRSSSDSKCTTF